MQYSTNFNMNKPELNEQYRLSHWNDNTDIIDAEMQAIRSGIDDVMKETLLNFCYPIGSIYWSGVATNPHDLFGGTWVQIKDCFVWAKGDNDTLDATGGEKTHTLTTTEMPSHTHTFTGSEVTSGGSSASNTGSESSHTHSVTASGSISVTTNPTFTGSEHSHTYTPAGTVQKHTHTLSSHTHNMEHKHGMNSTGGWTFRIRSLGIVQEGNEVTRAIIGTSNITTSWAGDVYTGHYRKVFSATGDSSYGWWDVSTANHTHTTNTLTNSGGTAITNTGAPSNNTSGETQPTFTGTQATLKATQGGTISGGAYKFTGSAVTSGSGSSHKHSMAHTHNVTASGSNANTGGGGAHNNMPPYVVKYCWQRTA